MSTAAERLVLLALALGLPAVGAAAASARVERTWGNDFRIDFDAPMQVMGNEVGEGAIRLEPETAVKCSWASDTRMQCRALDELQPATLYTVHVAPQRSLGSADPWPALRLSFETHRPAAQMIVASWEGGIPSLEVSASIEPEVGSLAAHLRVEFEGRSMSFKLSKRKPKRWPWDSEFRYELTLDRVPKRNGLLTFHMRPGLIGRGGNLTGTQNGVIGRAALRLRPELEGVSCGPPHAPVRLRHSARDMVIRCTPHDPIRLWFGAEIDDDTRDILIGRFRTAAGAAFEVPTRRVPRDLQGRAASPFVPDDTRAAPSHWIELGSLVPRQSVTARFDRRHMAAGGLRLGSVKLQVQTDAPTPQLTAKSARMLVDRSVRLANLMTLQGERPVSIRVESLGEQETEETIDLRPDGDRQPALSASAAARRSLEQGGWVRATPNGPGKPVGGYFNPGGIEIASPDFDLYVASGRRHVLVWANAWNGSGPVVGAKVELLMREDASGLFIGVAEGVTGVDGTALIALPESLKVDLPPGEEAEDWEGPEWAVRASVDQAGQARRAVLPVGRSSAWSPIGASRVAHAWGVSDRSMYRAGDSVRYQIWRREFVGTEMRQVTAGAPVTVQLWQDDNEKVILTWEEQALPGGTIAGSRRLPVHLTDGTYCIGVPLGHQTSGACFFVGTFNPQDLWLEANAAAAVLRDGDPWMVSVSAGYFSGGSAAGVELSLNDASLYAMALEEAYPDYRGFTFVDVYAEAVSDPDLRQPDVLPTELDAEGRATVRGRVSFKGADDVLASRPAFGILGISMEVQPEGREGTYAYSESLRYARYERYVGLRTTPAWFDAESEVGIEAVVIDALGHRVEDQSVEVRVEYLGAGYMETGERGPDPVLVATCAHRTGVAGRCEFERKRSGRYRLTALSGEAAPAVIERYIRVRGDESTTSAMHGVEPELTFIGDLDEPGQPLRFRLAQEHPSATALILFMRGDEVLERHVVEIDRSVQELTLISMLPRDVRYEVRALVRSRSPSRTEGGLREPMEVNVIGSDLPERPAKDPAKPSVRIAFEAESAAPEEEAVLLISNDANQAREIALTVTDDALRTQAQRWLPYADPKGPLWLSGPWMRGYDSMELIGFDDWRGDEWTWLIGVPKPVQEDAEPMLLMMAAPAPAADYGGGDADDEDAATLESIEVTGSRIKRADIVENMEIRAPQDGAAKTRRPDARSRPTAVPNEARLRTRFEDTALWMSGITLQPGEQRRIRVRLPHNLTRWRAIAWSADNGKGFEMTEAAIEVGLPLELRMQPPVRMYPGDVVEVAAHLRQNEGEPLTASLEVSASGAGADTSLRDRIELAPRGQQALRLRLAPDRPGALSLSAVASSPIGGDAVGAGLEVASRRMQTALVQAGWLDHSPRAVEIPGMPAGASRSELEVSIIRPDRMLTQRWTDMLRDYPHRCWEQILSRAVGAAVAIRNGDAAWADAAGVVDEALENAAVFQTWDGAFSFFADSSPPTDSGSSVALTAWSVRALGWLSEQGFAVPEHVVDAAQEYLVDRLPSDSTVEDDASAAPNLAAAAFAAAALGEPPRETVDALWRSWNSAPQPVQIAIARSMASSRHAEVGAALARILDSAPDRAGVRRLASGLAENRWLSSDLREQCALIGLVREFPDLVSAQTKLQLQRGLMDLYSEAASGIDTQAAAECLISVGAARRETAEPAAVTLWIGDQRVPLRLEAEADSVSWTTASPVAGVLRFEATQQTDAVAFLAELRFDEDMQDAAAKAIGLTVSRRYEVLEQGAWRPIDARAVAEGDWLRITLETESATLRRHVALTDQVPGGLQPIDPSLAGVVGSDLLKVADEGSEYFGTRRLDAKSPKFYAELLPPGTHPVHYFARVAHPGRFLAAPATAEVMYGTIGRARSAPARLTFVPSAAEASAAITSMEGSRARSERAIEGPPHVIGVSPERAGGH